MPFSHRHMSNIDRRKFLEYTMLGVGSAISASLIPAEAASAQQRFSRNPFTLGVASGDPSASGIVLWTRLAPDPSDPMALGPQMLPVGWRVATDDQMRRVVARGRARAMAELAHSVHVEVDGLRAGADYFYQFDIGGEQSPVGHFRTSPSRRETAKSLAFAIATCQDWPSGYFTPYRDMVNNDLDLVLHLGDYTYEYQIGSGNRELPPEAFRAETVDLRTYRNRHALYKLDPDLQAAHAKFPFAVTWDDHEVANDYSGLAPEYDVPSPAFAAKRAAAYQAWYEHMPVRSALGYGSDRGRGSDSDNDRRNNREDDREREENDREDGRTGDVRNEPNELRIYRRLNYGRLAEFTMLDTRQYRTDNPYGDGESDHNLYPNVGEYTMLGTQQERWVARGFAKSRSQWNIVGQGLLMAELRHPPYDTQDRYWNDAWDGYPAARQRLLSDVVNSGVRNPVFFAGDWHSTFANDLKLNFKDSAAPTIASEFVTPAITTGGDGTPYGPYYGPMVPFNPHIKYFEGDRRGYMLATVTSEQMKIDLRFVTSVENQNGTGYLEKTFIVENGRPGPQ
jgi:alkaline phosphatase D